MHVELTKTMILAITPLVLLHLSLAAFCLVKLYKEGTANLSKPVWAIIILFLNLIGSILFLAVGRVKDHD